MVEIGKATTRGDETRLEGGRPMRRELLFGTVLTVKQRKENALIVIADALQNIRIVESAVYPVGGELRRRAIVGEFWAEIRQAQEEWNEAACEEIMEE